MEQRSRQWTSISLTKRYSCCCFSYRYKKIHANSNNFWCKLSGILTWYEVSAAQLAASSAVWFSLLVSGSASLRDIKIKLTRVKIVCLEYSRNIYIKFRVYFLKWLLRAQWPPFPDLETRAHLHESGSNVFALLIYILNSKFDGELTLQNYF